MSNRKHELFIAANDSDDCDEPLPAGVVHERVEIVMAHRTEQYRVRRQVTRRPTGHPVVLTAEGEAGTAAECVTVLRDLCGGALSPVARLTLYDAGHDAFTGAVAGYPAFARAFAAAKLEVPRLLQPGH